MPRDTFSSGSDDSILVRAFGIVRRRKAIAAIVFATLLAAAVSFVLNLPDLYRASASVVVERPLSDLSRPGIGGHLEQRLYVIKQEVLSRDRLTELVKRFDLYPDLRDQMSFEDILTQARNDIDWVPNGPERASGSTATVTFDLTYTGSTPQVVADVTNAIADFYVAHNDQMRSDAARSQAQVLKTQLDTAKRDANEHEARMRTYSITHSGQLAQAMGVNTATYLQLSENLRYVRAEHARLDGERRRLEELAAEAVDAATTISGRTAAVTGSADVPASRELTELIGLFDKAKEDLEEATTVKGFGAGHQLVVALNERIRDLQKKIEDQQARDVAAHTILTERQAAAGTVEVPKALPGARRTIADVKEEMARLKKDEQELVAQQKLLGERFEGSGPVQQQYIVIQRDYEAARANHDALLREYERALQVQTVETGRQGERFRILDAAIPPEGPAAPNRLRLLITGFLLALGAATIAVIGAETLDTSFHTVEALRAHTRVACIS